jgi:hypothetical protein
VIAASVPFLVLFGASIATAGGRPDSRRSPWELVLVGGTIITGGLVLVISFIQLTLVDGVEQGISASALEAANALINNMWIAWNAGFGVMMLGAAGVFLSAVGRQRWLGWVALVLGVALFVPYADFIALLVTPVWIVATSIVLARDGSDRYAVAPTTA